MNQKGSKPNYQVHQSSFVNTRNVGNRTKIWAFCNILKGARIGTDCNICDHVFIENKVIVGNRVTIKSGVQLWDGINIEDDVFIGPNVTFTNDKYPRSKKHLKVYPSTIVKKGASVGANATILPGVTIGESAMIGAGAVVTKNVPPKAIIIGNPGIINGYVDTMKIKRNTINFKRNDLNKIKTSIKGVEIIKLPIANDIRGSLSYLEYEKEIPFLIKRSFVVYDVPSKEVRGEHAHKKTHQFLICIKGSLTVMVNDGKKSMEIVLTPMGLGLYIKPLVWTVHYKYSNDAMLLVFASDKYDTNEYIRSYEEFKKIINGK